MGLPGPGRTCSIGEVHLFRIEAGRIAEHWHQSDGLGMMQQLRPPQVQARRHAVAGA